MSKHIVVILLILVLLGIFVQVSLALKGDISFTSSSAGRRLVRFAYKNGGQALGTMTITPPANSFGNYQLWLIKRNAYTRLFDIWSNVDICDSKSTFDADAVWTFSFNGTSSGGSQTFPFSGSVKSGRGIYYLIYLNCDYNRATIKLHYEVVNPGGNQLGWDTEPLPYFYIILVVFWVVALALWVFNWIWHRDQRPWLHRVISVYPMVKLAWVFFSTIYWWALRKKGETATGVYVLYVIIYVAQEVCLYFIFLLIATGWCIARDYIRNTLKIAIAVELLLLAGSLLAGILFSRYFSLLVMLFYIVVIVCIFMWSREILVFLEGSPEAAGGSSSPPPPQPASGASQSSAPPQGSAADKYTMMHRFRYAMLTFVCLLMVWNFFIVLFLFDYIYVDTMFSELLSCGMAIAIGLIFRLRKENLYYLLSAEYSGGSNSNCKAPAAEFS